MKNSSDVIALLAGHKCPTNERRIRNHNAAILAILDSDITADQHRNIHIHMLDLLEFGKPVDSCQAVAAILLATAPCWADQFTFWQNALKDLLRLERKDWLFHPNDFYDSILEGCAEAMSSIFGKENLTEDLMSLFFSFYLEFLFIPTKRDSVPDKYLGRLSNASSAFMSLPHIDKLFFAELPKHRMTEAAEPYINEFCSKRLLRLGTEIKMGICAKFK